MTVNRLFRIWNSSKTCSIVFLYPSFGTSFFLGLILIGWGADSIASSSIYFLPSGLIEIVEISSTSPSIEYEQQFVKLFAEKLWISIRSFDMICVNLSYISLRYFMLLSRRRNAELWSEISVRWSQIRLTVGVCSHSIRIEKLYEDCIEVEQRQ